MKWERRSASALRTTRRREYTSPGSFRKTNSTTLLTTLISLTSADGVVAALDRSHRASAAAAVTMHEVQLRDVVTLQNGVGGVAHVASHVYADVLLQDGGELLVRIAALDDELVLSVEGTVRSQLAEDEAEHMLVLAIHLVAVVHEVDPAGLRRADTRNLGQRHAALLRSSEFGIVGLDLSVHTVQNLAMIRNSKCVRRRTCSTDRQRFPPSCA